MKIPQSLIHESLEDSYKAVIAERKERKGNEIPKMKKEEGFEE